MPIKRYIYISGPRMGTNYSMTGIPTVTGIPKKTSLSKFKKKTKKKK